jgi:hypothetical protein
VKHPGNKPWFEKDRCGPLFVFYCDDDEGGIDWYICPDDEDKCTQRRTILKGNAPSPEEALQQVAAAVTKIAQDRLVWANAPVDPSSETKIR